MYMLGQNHHFLALKKGFYTNFQKFLSKYNFLH